MCGYWPETVILTTGAKMIRALQSLLLSLAVLLAMTQLAKGDEVLIFSADWCGNCKSLKADMKRDQSAMSGYIWGYVDVEKEKELAKQYGIRSLPTIVVVDKDNKEVKRQVGYRSMEQLRKWLQDKNLFESGVRHDSKHHHRVGVLILDSDHYTRWHY